MKASSESGECASLISTVSFSILEAVCWPDMGLLVSLGAHAKRLASLPALVLPRDYPACARVNRSRTGENARVAGVCKAPGRTIFCRPKPNILLCCEQLAGT